MKKFLLLLCYWLSPLIVFAHEGLNHGGCCTENYTAKLRLHDQLHESYMQKEESSNGAEKRYWRGKREEQSLIISKMQFINARCRAMINGG